MCKHNTPLNAAKLLLFFYMCKFFCNFAENMNGMIFITKVNDGR